MLAARVRSGLVETTHDGVVAISRPDGSLVAWSGDIDRPFYLRSSAKPFQAYVSQMSGAGLEPIQLAMAAASHRGLPVHVAIVDSVLARAGLSARDLRTPPDWPISGEAARHRVRTGERSPRRIWHNCSGKHAGFLRACVAQGWPTDTYLTPEHPLQRRIVAVVSELGEHPVEPLGVDGCGAPVLRTTARAMSLLFARFAAEPAFDEVRAVMHRYPALIASNGEGDSLIATAINAVAKGGAQGCIGVSVGSRLGVAAKSWDGLMDVAEVAAVAALDAVDELSRPAAMYLEKVGRPDVVGGGEVVGSTESRLELEFV
ncbi:MAG: asparaginase [Acidobacteria bacterium]|nr:asparaginase [Acidobacteriota bacterium]